MINQFGASFSAKTGRQI